MDAIQEAELFQLMGRIEGHLNRYDSDRTELWDAIDDTRDELHGVEGNNGLKSKLKETQVRVTILATMVLGAVPLGLLLDDLPALLGF